MAKSRKQCNKCAFINTCETIDEWRNKVRNKELKRSIYNHRISNWETNNHENLNCPDYERRKA
jgi:hypothetical protein